MVDSKLLTFLKVADKGSYTLAAQELSLTQPAVSQQMKLLETELGVKLFNRVDNSLKLTYQGEIVKKFARRIVSLYGELDSKLSDEQAGRRSYVIGITHTSEANLIAEVLAHYAEEHPGVKIKILSDSIKKLYEKLSTFEIDLAIVDGASTNKKYCSIPLDTDSLVVVMAKSHPLAKKASIGLDDLKKERLIRMKPAREVSQTEKIIFPIVGLLMTAFIVPSGLPLLGMLFFGNLLKESTKTTRLAKTAGSALNDTIVMLLGLTVGCSTQASEFLTWDTIKIFLLGALAFIIATASGVLFVKFFNLFLPKSKKINPLIGNAGVSAVPMAARISQNLGLEYDSKNYLLMHAMGPNVAGVIGSAVAAGVLLGFLS